MTDSARPGLLVGRRTRSVSVRQVDAPVPVQIVTVVGEVDAATAPQLQAVLTEACTSRDVSGRVVVDAAPMTFCGARGLDVLHRGSELAADHAVVFALAGLTPRLARLLQDLWPAPTRALFPDCATAVAMLAEHGAPGDEGSAPTAHAHALARAAQHTLARRATTEQAVGVLGQHGGIGAERARAHLRAYADEHDYALGELADDVVHGRVEPAAVLGVSRPEVAPPGRLDPAPPRFGGGSVGG